MKTTLLTIELDYDESHLLAAAQLLTAYARTFMLPDGRPIIAWNEKLKRAELIEEGTDPKIYIVSSPSLLTEVIICANCQTEQFASYIDYINDTALCPDCYDQACRWCSEPSDQLSEYLELTQCSACAEHQFEQYHA